MAKSCFPLHLSLNHGHGKHLLLDADKGDRLESSAGRVASRDIVQFIPLRDVQSKCISSKSIWDGCFNDFLFFIFYF